MMSRFHRKHVAGFCTLAFAAALSLILLSGNDEKPARHPVIPEQAAVARILSGMRIPFQENAGQFSPEIAYGARMFSGAAFVTREGEIIYSLYERAGGGSACKVRVFREILIGGRTLEISAEAPSPASVSRFAGNDPSRWIRSIRAWETVRFDRVYDGIDVKLKAHGGSVEKFFHVRPGGDPSAIRLRIEGADRLAINKRGELEAVVGKETVLFSAPVAWQDDGERRIPVAADYEVDGNEYGFRLAAYDPNREIVIDPLLAATYLGGSGPAGTGQGVPDGLDDQPYAIDFDSSGNIYVAGATASSNFAPGNGYDNTFDAASPALTDAFVVKLSGDLTQILAATFLGGSSDDMATSVRVRSSSVYVAGATKSADFPLTSGTYSNLPKSDWNAFVVKMDLSLSSLEAAAAFGGNFADNEVSMALDASGNVFLAGRTQSPDFPVTSGVYDNVSELLGPPEDESSDFFVSRLDGNLSSSSFVSTFLGGTATGFREANPAISVDGDGNVVLAGISEAADYPTTDNAYSRIGGGARMVVSKLNGDLSSLVASTFVVAGDLTYAPSLSLAGDNVWIGGYASGEGFIAKLNSSLSSLLASVSFGGSMTDFVTGIYAASDGSLFAVGQTASVDFPKTPGAYDNNFDGSYDLFICRYDAALSTLLASTLMPQSPTLSNRLRASVALDGSGNVYTAGITSSTAFPATPGAVQSTLTPPSGGVARFDGFIAKFTQDLSGETAGPTVASVSPSAGAIGVPVDNTIRVKFSEWMRASTIDNASIRVSGASDNVAGTVSYGGADNTATFTPAAPLASSTTYTVTVGTAVQDFSGNAMATQFTSTFTTQSASGGSSGGGGGGGCTLSQGRKSTVEDGWPSIPILLIPLAYLASRRLRARRGAGMG